MKVVGIIQARQGATRLPGKMMMAAAGRPMVAHVVERARAARAVNEVWLATTTDPSDDVLAAWAKENGLLIYRGSVNDVLDRYYQAAHASESEVVVRLTGDCPLHDPEVIDLVVKEFLAGDYDYVCNTLPPTYPDGLDVEVFSRSVLARAWQEAKLPSEREHVTPYIWKHPEWFKIKNVRHDPDLSSERWTLDTPEDFAFIKTVLEACAAQNLRGILPEILHLVWLHPKWRALNTGQIRNAGYAKSVAADNLAN